MMMMMMMMMMTETIIEAKIKHESQTNIHVHVNAYTMYISASKALTFRRLRQLVCAELTNFNYIVPLYSIGNDPERSTLCSRA